MGAEEVDIAASVTGRRLIVPLTLSRLWADYSLAAIALGLTVWLLAAMDHGGPHASKLWATAAVSCVVGCILAWSSHDSYALRAIPADGDRRAIAARARAAIDSLGWHCIHEDEHLLIAMTKPTGFTWGQSITLIPLDGWLFFNSRNSSRGGAPLSYGWSRKHFLLLSTYLQGSPTVAEELAQGFDPDRVRSGRNIGCTVLLVPLVAILALGLRRMIYEAMGHQPPPSYLGEPVHDADTTIVLLLFLGAFASFFAAVLANLVMGLIANQERPIISVPLTLTIHAGILLVASALVTDGSSTGLALAGLGALAVSIVLCKVKQRRT